MKKTMSKELCEIILSFYNKIEELERAYTEASVENRDEEYLQEIQKKIASLREVLPAIERSLYLTLKFKYIDKT